MFNFFDLDIIPTFLSRFKVEKILVIGFSNKLIKEEIITFFINNECLLYVIGSEIDEDNLINEYDNSNNILENIKYFKGNSLNILPKLSNMDAIFINGDPNWYTVYNELNLIRDNNRNFPIVFVCNNKYPHNHRDSYINPEEIPEEYRNEYCDKLPILHETNNETKYVMVNDGFCHAIHKDTPKNGVLTAIKDFLKENTSFKSLEINPIEGISLIYEPTKITDIKLNKILRNKKEHNFDKNNLSEKLNVNNILLNNISEINSFNEDLNRVEKLKSEIKDKEKQLKEYEDKIQLKNKEIKYWESKISNIESQINLKEAKIQNEKAKLLNKNKEINEKESKLLFKDKEIKSKDEELKSINSKLLDKIRYKFENS